MNAVYARSASAARALALAASAFHRRRAAPRCMRGKLALARSLNRLSRAMSAVRHAKRFHTRASRSVATLVLSLAGALATNAAGLAFLKANKDKEGVVELPSGLQYK